MRRIVQALALFAPLSLALLATPAQPAQAAPRHAAHAPVKPPPPHPALWKVADADTTIWLFGTIHALPPGVPWFAGPVAAALNGADELVTEIPQTEPAAMQDLIMAHALLPEGQTLRAAMTPADRSAYEQALARFGLPAAALDRFEPWYAAIALTALPLAKSGYSAANGVEEKIAAAAAELGHPRSGLETAESQVALFDTLPVEVQQAYLHEVIATLPTIDQQLAAIVREWQAGHADRLAELLNAEEDDPRMVAALLTNRNRAWAEWVSQRLDRPGVVFMAVGAGHLAGKDSVQDMLRRRGILAVRVQ